jgi:sugar/nucleoside kinase (ribokinase family)
VNHALEAEGPAAAGDERLDVVGVGSPLVDVLARVDDAQLDALGLDKGAMTLVDLAQAEVIRSVMSSTRVVSGGSAANTMAGVAALGGRAGFVGKIADDELGRHFIEDIRACGVHYEPTVDGTGGTAEGAPGEAAERRGTGRCLVLVTGDAERTMATHLGVATTIGPGDLPEALLARGHVVYLEGYLWDLPPAKEALRRAVQLTHAREGAIALSLSDPFCVERHRADFLALVESDVEVLFGNEEEITRLFGVAGRTAALRRAEASGLLVAMTLGAEGSVAVTPSGTVAVPAAPVERVVDTTGAGDLYAAGFLHGLTRGREPEECARLGSVCAAEVISHLGARPEADLGALAARVGLG